MLVKKGWRNTSDYIYKVKWGHPIEFVKTDKGWKISENTIRLAPSLGKINWYEPII